MKKQAKIPKPLADAVARAVSAGAHQQRRDPMLACAFKAFAKAFEEMADAASLPPKKK